MNQDKSCYIVIGSQEIKSEMKNELKMYPLTLYGIKMPERKSESYLGDFIHEGGVSASVEATVNHRYGKLIHGIKEIKAIIICALFGRHILRDQCGGQALNQLLEALSLE